MVRSWRKLIPDLDDDDLQGFRDEINRPKILDTVCATRSFENIDDHIEELLQSDVCEPGFHTWTLPMLPRNRRVRTRVGRMRAKLVLPCGVVYTVHKNKRSLQNKHQLCEKIESNLCSSVNEPNKICWITRVFRLFVCHIPFINPGVYCNDGLLFEVMFGRFFK
jgi:hypothetical protein